MGFLLMQRKAWSVCLTISIFFSEKANLHFMSYFLSFLFYASDMNINVEHRKLWCQFFRIDLLNEEEEEEKKPYISLPPSWSNWLYQIILQNFALHRIFLKGLSIFIIEQITTCYMRDLRGIFFANKLCCLQKSVLAHSNCIEV